MIRFKDVLREKSIIPIKVVVLPTGIKILHYINGKIEIA